MGETEAGFDLSELVEDVVQEIAGDDEEKEEEKQDDAD